MQQESDRDKKYDLEKRLIDFAVRIIDLVEVESVDIVTWKFDIQYSVFDIRCLTYY